MNDILFDVSTREIVMVGNDFAQTPDPSVQNGGILLYGRCFNPLLPMFGIGLTPEIINGNTRDLTYEQNRWVSQAVLDGATIASWSGTTTPQNANIVNNISYD